MATRAEHRRATLHALSSATTAAFEELGPTATIDDIAERAGVSRRTVFRYVDTKESLVFIHPVLWLEVFDDAVSEVAERPLRERVMHAARAISGQIDADPEPVWRAMRVAQQDPTLIRGYAVVTRRWVNRIASEVMRDADVDDTDAPFRARVLGAAVMGVIDAALASWFASEPREHLADTVERGLDYLAPVFNTESTPPTDR